MKKVKFKTIESNSKLSSFKNSNKLNGRIYHPYWLWEDYKNGMYTKQRFTEKEEEQLSYKVKEFLENQKLFLETGLKVIKEWKYATEQNLSNKARNRQAWIGQASCCYHLKAPEYITKYGWRLIDLATQQIANQTADKIIKEWENSNA